MVKPASVGPVSPIGVNQTAEETKITDVKPTPVSPPIVVTNKKVTLADHLDLRNLPLATTPGGKNFALKALHPSEHTIKAARVPGGNKMSVAIHMDAVGTFSVPDLLKTHSGNMWRITQSPNIACPCLVECLTSDYAPVVNYDFMNSALGGQVMGANPGCTQLDGFFENNIAGKIREYRITSQSVTVELVAPALADQGTIISAITDNPPQTFSFVYQGATPNDPISLQPDIHLFKKPPTDDKLLLGANTYTGKARDGVYQPLKISSFKWRNARDPAFFANTDDDETYRYNVSYQDTLQWPIYCNNTDSTFWNKTPVWPKMCGNLWGITYLKGMSNDASIRVRVRQVMEITAPVSTVYAPLLEPALPPDELAMKMYFEISSKLADGYPASYNDLGWLKDLIGKMAKAFSPLVDPALSIASNLPVVGPVVSMVKGAVTAGKEIKKAVQESKAKKQDRKSVV